MPCGLARVRSMGYCQFSKFWNVCPSVPSFFCRPSAIPCARKVIFLSCLPCHVLGRPDNGAVVPLYHCAPLHVFYGSLRIALNLLAIWYDCEVKIVYPSLCCSVGLLFLFLTSLRTCGMHTIWLLLVLFLNQQQFGLFLSCSYCSCHF